MVNYTPDENDDEDYLVCGGEGGCGALVADTEAHDQFHRNVEFAVVNSKRAYTKAKALEDAQRPHPMTVGRDA